MKFKSYKYELILKLIVVITLILTIIIGFNFYFSRQNLIKKYQNSETRVISQATNILNQTDVLYQILNNNMNKQMKEFSKEIAQVYSRNNGNLSNQDLKELKRKYEVSDIYLINKQGIIEKTTFAKDQGLNLFKAIKGFDKFLTDVRTGDEFVSNKIALEQKTNKFKKFTYYPAPDHEYIIELGWYAQDFDPTIKKTSFQKITKDIVEQNYLIKNIRLFDLADFRTLGDMNYKLPQKHQIEIKNKANQDKIMLNENTKSYGQLEYVYKKVAFSSMNHGRLIQIVLNKEKLITDLRKEIFLNLGLFLLGLLITVGISYLLSKDIISLINKVKNKVVKLGNGDLTVQIVENREDEFGELAKSFNQTVKRQRKLITNIFKLIEDLSSYSNEISKVDEKINDTFDFIKGVKTGNKETAAAIDEISISIEEIAKGTESLSVKAETISELGTETFSIMKEADDKINFGTELVNEAVKVMEDLENSVSKVDKISEKIMGIADETNLLSLDGAIEAADSGGAGQGFASVADDIKDLADESMKSAKEVKEIVTEVKEVAERTINIMVPSDESHQNIADVFKEIQNLSGDLMNKAEQVTETTEDQVASTEEISASTEEISASTEEVSAQADKMYKNAQELENIMSQVVEANQNLNDRFKEQAQESKEKLEEVNIEL
ncbi:methyl-accepting chemotaxis protein [Halanaerobacter jeridensis]|uniref:Methyl-accepting chemotaxis protein n=1 Tax=Halanaerobacter jeridensis TaxID=706427 RepID=A0A938XUZ2_9FIRM|nr:HAMP domain-containing methyl-accepting chemotaxis protein [Halanaerobacter jeridensis]MBM7558010.1 methyl-accepting chemotaxis protein [Halanaerobacter jeridensis]